MPADDTVEVRKPELRAEASERSITPASRSLNESVPIESNKELRAAVLDPSLSPAPYVVPFARTLTPISSAVSGVITFSGRSGVYGHHERGPLPSILHSIIMRLSDEGRKGYAGRRSILGASKTGEAQHRADREK